MPATILTPADRSQVYIKAFDYGKDGVYPDDGVLPLTGAGGIAGYTTGESVLVGGTVVVPNTAVTANSRIFLSRRLSGGTPGFTGYTRSAGVGFTITNTSATDTSTISWMVVG